MHRLKCNSLYRPHREAVRWLGKFPLEKAAGFVHILTINHPEAESNGCNWLTVALIVPNQVAEIEYRVCSLLSFLNHSNRGILRPSNQVTVQLNAWESLGLHICPIPPVFGREFGSFRCIIGPFPFEMVTLVA